jgi:hypothetical protein
VINFATDKCLGLVDAGLRGWRGEALSAVITSYVNLSKITAVYFSNTPTLRKKLVFLELHACKSFISLGLTPQKYVTTQNSARIHKGYLPFTYIKKA